MHRKVYIEVNGDEVEAAYAENGEIIRYYRFDGDVAGSIYRGKVVRITDAGAFIDIGREKNGFLPKRTGLKAGDFVTVTSEREESGHKGCLLSEKLTLCGKFVVITSSENIRFSRKITEKRRIELSSVFSEKGVIFRTACETGENAEISTEIIKLKNELSDVVAKGKNTYKTCVLKRADPKEIAYNIAPDAEVIIGLEKIRDELNRLTARKVETDGVEIVIDKTEAMTVIDVNSHKRKEGYTSEEDSSASVNGIAAEMVAKQIRLRNIGGLIAVDFVSMSDKTNVEKLKDKLTELLKLDDVMCRMEFVDSMCIALISRKKRYRSSY